MIKQFKMCAKSLVAMNMIKTKDNKRSNLDGVNVRKVDNSHIDIESTNGHMAAIMKVGLSDDRFFIEAKDGESFIIKASTDLIRICDRKFAYTVEFDFKTDIAQVWDYSGHRIGCGLFEIVEETYPDVREVFPKHKDLKEIDGLTLNYQYIELAGKCFNKIHPGKSPMIIKFTTKTSPLYLSSPNIENLGICLMPMADMYSDNIAKHYLDNM